MKKGLFVLAFGFAAALVVAKAHAVQTLSLGFIAPWVGSTSDVASPEKGEIVYDTSSNSFKGRTNSTWVGLDANSSVAYSAWAHCGALTFHGFTTTSSTSHSLYCRRVGDTLHMRGTVTATGTNGNNASIEPPSSNTIDTAKLSASGSILGVGNRFITGASRNMFSNGDMMISFFDGSTNNEIFLTDSAGSSAYTKLAGSTWGSTPTFFVDAVVPISGW
ncbi:hypothetical protein K2X30_13040 [bacterium]|nr:hypothetical protein [bacterium]